MPDKDPSSLASDVSVPLEELKVEQAAADRGRGAAERKESVPAGGGKSFSELMAGAMSRPPPILTVPVVALPCLLTPSAALIESSGGQFTMTHQAVLATVTAQAQLQMQKANPSSESMANTFSQPLLSPMSPMPLQQLPSPLPEGSASDVYNWRKYGQKQVKSSDNSRSYYRCTNANCLAKKKVERRPDGTVVDVTYRGKHSHEPPKKYRYTRDKGHQNTGASEEHENMEQLPSVSSKDDHISGSEIPEQQLFCSSDCEVDTRIKSEEDGTEEPDSKRRLIESPKWSPTPSTKIVREYIVQTEIDARHLSDGYRWRKYGQKLVKGNPNPRSYYRCTHEGCPVRKHVEKASHDAKSLIITYEGKHNHDQPASKFSSDPLATTPKCAIAAEANEKPDASSSPANNNSNADHAAKTIADEKTSKLGDNNEANTTMESAEAHITIGLKSADENADKMNSENVQNHLSSEGKAAISVQHS